MFIVHVVPLFAGTETTMSPSRHRIRLWISGSTQPGPRGRSGGDAADADVDAVDDDGADGFDMVTVPPSATTRATIERTDDSAYCGVPANGFRSAIRASL